MVFLSADLSTVESRIELMLAASTPEAAGSAAAREAVRLAQAHPSEFDIHRYAASVILDKSEADVRDTDDAPERYLGKRSMYGYQRGMGAPRLSDLMLKDGYVVTPETCQRYLGKLAAKLPVIADAYFPDIRRQLMRYRGLGNTWGGIWRCDYARFEEHLYAEGYSYQPVRDTVDLINQRGFLPLRDAIRLRTLVSGSGTAPRINVHGHDSLLVSCHPDDAWAVARFLEATLAEHEQVYAPGALKVPVTFQIGSTWRCEFEWKKLPPWREMRDAAWACEEKTAHRG